MIVAIRFPWLHLHRWYEATHAVSIILTDLAFGCYGIVEIT